MEKLLLGLMLLLGYAAAQQTQTVSPGDSIDPFAIADQHGKSVEVNEDVRLLLFSRDMKANKIAKQAFLKAPEDFLPKGHAIYLIDVSGMPSIVTKLFAVPKMQDYSYRVFLDRDASLTTGLPSEEAKVTVMHLDKLKVQSIEFVDSPEALTKAVSEAAQ